MYSRSEPSYGKLFVVKFRMMVMRQQIFVKKSKKESHLNCLIIWTLDLDSSSMIAGVSMQVRDLTSFKLLRCLHNSDESFILTI